MKEFYFGQHFFLGICKIVSIKIIAEIWGCID